MAETIRELLIKVGLDGKTAIDGLRKIDGSFASLKRGASIAIGAIGAIGASFLGIAKSAASAGVELKKTSTILGIPTAELQKLRGAAKLAAMDTESFTTAMRFFGKTTGAAIQGSKEQLKAFHKLGVTSFKDSNGHIKSQTQLLEEVAERMSHVRSVQEKLRITAQLFGRGAGADMLSFFSGGVGKMKAMEKAFEKFGYTLTDNDIKNSEEFTWTLKLLGMAAEGTKNKIGYMLLPYLNKWGVEVLKLVGQHRTLKGEMNLFLDAAKITFPTISTYIKNTVDHLSDLIDSMETLWEKTDKFLHIKQAAKMVLAGAEEGAQDFNWLLSGAASDIKKGMGANEYSKDIYINKRLLEMAKTGDYTGGKKIGAAQSSKSEKHIVVNNSPTINITVPPGTVESQQAWFKSAAGEFADNAIQKEIKNIHLAFPLTEGA
jgi:hypothetical protein